jgi:hypothetical protein
VTLVSIKREEVYAPRRKKGYRGPTFMDAFRLRPLRLEWTWVGPQAHVVRVPIRTTRTRVALIKFPDGRREEIMACCHHSSSVVTHYVARVIR